MEPKTQISNDVPTALPGFEDEDAREKLLLEKTAQTPNVESDEDEDTDLIEEKAKPKKRRWQVMRTVGGFAIFVGILGFAVSWFFGMGRFAESKSQPVSRTASKDSPASPATGDEKLKMAISMIGESNSNATGTPPPQIDLQSTRGEISVPESDSVNGVSENVGMPMKTSATRDEPPFTSLPSANNAEIPKPTMQKNETPPAISRTDGSSEPLGRSLFFGVTRKPPVVTGPERASETRIQSASVKDAPRKGIPFGTLLPVRLVGSVYTLRNSSGVVRLELTRQIEGEDYSYPAGTTVIGNIRGGESTRAFVTIVGLIDPVSGELVKFGGELLGTDGASGIEGKNRRLTSQWARFFDGLKETASSVLGSIGAFRSGGTVILSEPIRRGSESMSEDLSDALLKSRKEDTFIEVSAGANGYVLVTDLPRNSSEMKAAVKVEAADK